MIAFECSRKFWEIIIFVFAKMWRKYVSSVSAKILNCAKFVIHISSPSSHIITLSDCAQPVESSL